MPPLSIALALSVRAEATVTTGTDGVLGEASYVASELAVVGEVMLFGESVLTIVHHAGTWDASRVEQSRTEGHSNTSTDETFVSQESVSFMSDFQS